MTRLILAAGVAALAITAPASAKPDRQGGNRVQATEQQRAQRPQKAKRAPVSSVAREGSPRVSAPVVERKQSVAQVQRRDERVRPQRTERVQTRSAERQQVRTDRADQGRARR